MALSNNSRERFNFSGLSVLLVDSDRLGLSILSQILFGFGARKFTRCDDPTAALKAVQEEAFQLAIVDAMDGKGFDFVRRLRRMGGENWNVPLILTSGYTPISAVAQARDCGADMVIAKPLSPITVLDRIVCLARSRRQLLSTDRYVGPDRRFAEGDRAEGPRRRISDRDPVSIDEAS